MNKKFTPAYLLKIYETDHSAYSLPLEFAEDLDPYFAIPSVVRVRICTLLSTSAIIDYSHKAIFKCDSVSPVLNQYLVNSFLYSEYVVFNVPDNMVDDFYFNFSTYLASTKKHYACECNLSALVAFCRGSRSLP